jgi:hypothetical protein
MVSQLVVRTAGRLVQQKERVLAGPWVVSMVDLLEFELESLLAVPKGSLLAVMMEQLMVENLGTMMVGKLVV